MPRSRIIAIVLLAVFGLGGIATVFLTQRDSGAKAKEPPFTKEGTLQFLENSDQAIIKQIDIEIADNDAERQQGLMWRKSMEDTQGMLFIFPTMQAQSFWMKNTYIPLDILFINDGAKIVNVAKDVQVLNERQVRSGVNAQYVLEVNAGFCERYGIEKGDYIKVE